MNTDVSSHSRPNTAESISPSRQKHEVKSTKALARNDASSLFRFSTLHLFQLRWTTGRKT